MVVYIIIYYYVLEWDDCCCCCDPWFVREYYQTLTYWVMFLVVIWLNKKKKKNPREWVQLWRYPPPPCCGADTSTITPKLPRIFTFYSVFFFSFIPLLNSYPLRPTYMPILFRNYAYICNNNKIITSAAVVYVSCGRLRLANYTYNNKR